MPCVIGIGVAIFLPESLEFLVKKGKDVAQIHKIIYKIAPKLSEEKDIDFVSSEKKLAGAPVKNLFTDGRAFSTILIWIAFFASFYLLWLLLSWAPTLLKKSGASVQQFSIAFACINIGSALATVTIGILMDRFSPFKILGVGFILAFLSVVVFGYAAGSPFIVVAILSVVMGFFVIGGNSGLMGLATVSYPTDMRGTGLGWAYAIGKIGSLLAPIAGGFMLTQNWTVPRICTTNALAALVVVVVVTVLGKVIFTGPARAKRT